jgi:hypothetical protein
MAEAPLSLYFDLEPGQTADIEVVSRAAIAWSATIKEIAYILDPTVEVRVEIASGTASSLNLHSFLRFVGKHVKEAQDDPVTMKAIVIALAIHFGWEALDKGFDKLFPDDEIVTLSPVQMDQLAEKIERARGAAVARSHAAQVFREAQRDPAIKGVGIGVGREGRPAVIVPRAEFQGRSGQAQIKELSIQRRIVHNMQIVTLIKPVLVPGDRRWSLRTAQGEFGFRIGDTSFVERVLSGTTEIPMVAGIEMNVETETTEEFRDGVWVPTERKVVRVLGLRSPERQGVLTLPPREDHEPGDGGN